MMRRLSSFKLKFQIYLVFVVLAIISVSTLVTGRITQNYLDRMQNRDLIQWGKDFEAIIDDRLQPENYPELARQVDEILKERPGDFTLLFNAAKEQVMRSGVGGEDFGDPGELTDHLKLIAQGDYNIVTLPVKDHQSEDIRGYILYGRSLRDKKEALASIRSYMVYWVLALFFAAAVVLHFISRRMTHPVVILKEGFERVSRGDMSYRVHIDSSDEFGFLADQFNEMVRQLESMMRELENSRRDLENQVHQRTRDLNHANSQLQRAMEELKYTQDRIIRTETQKSLTSIVSGFAHEINNPLTGILGYIDLIELNPGLEPRYRKRLDGIKDQALRIKDIINDLSQLDPEIEQVKKKIDLSNLLEKLCKIIKKENEKIDMCVTNRYEDRELKSSIKHFGGSEDLIVYGNHFSLWQVFDGVIENSLEAIRERGVENGRIVVELKPCPAVGKGNVVVEIRDNGGGFAHIEKAFNPFFTTRNRTRKRGIGLSIAFNLVREHGGNIAIRNREGGASVLVQLPCYRGGAQEDKSMGNEAAKEFGHETKYN